MVSAPPGGASTGVLRFAALDALRGVAALIVAAHHLHGQGPIFGSAFLTRGGLFVDFFFVLSGFVIAAAYGERLRAGFPALRFLWIRLGRVWPVHAVMLLAYLAIELIVLVSGNSSLTGRAAFAAERQIGDLLVQAALLQAFVPSALYTWVVQSWSIAIEVLLYLLVAFGWRLAGRWWWQASLAAALAAGVALASVGDAEPFTAHLRGLTGFGLGAASFVLWLRVGAQSQLVPKSAASLAEAIVALVALPAVPVPLLAYDLLFAAAVLTFAAGRGALSQLLQAPALLFVGAVSYSLYMVHGLVQSLFLSGLAWAAGLIGMGDRFVTGAAANRPGLPASAGLGADLVGLLAMAAALLAAWAMYRLVEAPARQWSRRRAGML
ncbi:MAG: acyltransferase family protein [Pseudomonadota bacterium]